MESAVPPDVSRTASEGRLPFLSNVNAVSDDVAERVTIEHRHLRSAIEFAVAIADAGQRLRPPLAYPADLKPYLKSPRVPSSALGKLRRAIESDDRFRRRLAAGVVGRDGALCQRVAARLRAGIVWVNSWGESPAEMAVGGWKKSGLGVENGKRGLEGWVQNKSTLLELGGSVPTVFCKL